MWGRRHHIGYKKDPNNKYQLIIDEPAAMVVREIFSNYLKGMGTTQIASDLSLRKIDIPSVYKGINRGNRSLKYGLWCNRTVKHILQNETYTGCLVQNKYNKLNYKSKKTIETTPDKWIKVENTHEAIIEKEKWERVQTLLIRENRSRITRNDYILSGLLRCYECRGAIGIGSRKNQGYSYGRCQRYVKYSKFNVCTPHSFNYQKLEKNIVDVLRKICKEHSDRKKLQELAKNNKNINIEAEYKQKINFYMNMAEKENRKMDTLYEDRLEGVISVDEYKRMAENIKTKRDENIKIQKEYEKRLIEHQNNIKNSDTEKLNKLIDEFLSMKSPTKEIMGQFIDRIEIHQNKQVDIYFKFQPFNDINNKKLYAK